MFYTLKILVWIKYRSKLEMTQTQMLKKIILFLSPFSFFSITLSVFFLLFSSFNSLSIFGCPTKEKATHDGNLVVVAVSLLWVFDRIWLGLWQLWLWICGSSNCGLVVGIWPNLIVFVLSCVLVLCGGCDSDCGVDVYYKMIS